MRLEHEMMQGVEYSVVYGMFRGEDQELFRVNRQLEETDLKEYVNRERAFFGLFENDDTPALNEVKGYQGYYRLYWSGRWYGTWIENGEKIDSLTCKGIDLIVEWLGERFPNGCGICDWDMEEFLENFKEWGEPKRYLLKPLYSDHYKVQINISEWNDGYPIRIFVYE